MDRAYGFSLRCSEMQCKMCQSNIRRRLAELEQRRKRLMQNELFFRSSVEAVNQELRRLRRAQKGNGNGKAVQARR